MQKTDPFGYHLHTCFIFSSVWVVFLHIYFYSYLNL